MTDDVRLIRTPVHGRVLVRASGRPPTVILLGFHGYAENAAMQMERLEEVRGAHEDWTLVSVQGLHRFYRGRTETVVAAWMTREDREAAIADVVDYIDAVVRSLRSPAETPIVCAGFSQGVAAAFRAAVRGSFRCAAVIAAGGDVPPELLADPSAVFPPALIARGRDDEWFTQSKLDGDVAALRARGTRVETALLESGHEWTGELSARASAFIAALASSARAASRLPPPSATS